MYFNRPMLPNDIIKYAEFLLGKMKFTYEIPPKLKSFIARYRFFNKTANIKTQSAHTFPSVKKIISYMSC